MSNVQAKVCARRCSSCVFGPNSPISPERLREQAAKWANNSGHQICHHFGVGDDDTGDRIGEDVWCRGFYETQTPKMVRQYMERVLEPAGIVEFVDPPDEFPVD